MDSIRIDKFLASKIEGISRSKIQSLITIGRVFVNGRLIIDSNHRLKIKDEISINLDLQPNKFDLSPNANIGFHILYEDEDLLVINKPAGIVVHPGAGNRSNTLVNGLLFHCGNSLSVGTDEFRPGIVHRIDKNTSGILVVAKNDWAHQELAKQFSTHLIIRKYICFCYAVLFPLNDKVETFIARDRRNRLKMSISKDCGKNAITIYKTVKTFSTFASKVECELKTGRTHQIRVHLSHMGHSLIGDSLYKSKNYYIPEKIADYIHVFPRQALHAYFLDFIHPRFQQAMHFETKLPDDLQELENILSENAETQKFR
ncbi:MAG: RluA family pseudouridine synthase [Holosporaceae bacterium]|nr:RluA family pseudouridine synthase [Holosporaceae bacterium]